MTTKTKPSKSISALWGHFYDTFGQEQRAYYKYATGSETITYQDLRKISGRWPWKTCQHDTVAALHPFCGSFSGDIRWSSSYTESYRDRYKAPLENVKLPNVAWDPAAFQSILDQIDLNKGESTLLYSGILQAIPLLGPVANLTSTLNRAARKLSKSFKRKPFTTVVKSMISLDFIDRFVVSPTLDDARRFQAACDYVINVINTAQERSASPFALQSGVTTVLKDTSESITVGSYRGRIPPIRATRRNRQLSESKAFALLSAQYDVGGLAPLKLWARRVGLTRPLDSVWDLVPFSFVIDYFTRAGDFISRLSDEMSDVEGLKGKCLRIHDLWYTHKLSGSSEVTGDGLTQSWESYDYYAGRYPCVYSFVPAKAFLRNERFVRQRIANPYSYLLSFNERLSDYLSVNLDLSSTRKRTIAELVIQAKL